MSQALIVMALALLASVICGAAGVAVLAGLGWMLIFLAACFGGLGIVLARGMSARG